MPLGRISHRGSTITDRITTESDVLPVESKKQFVGNPNARNQHQVNAIYLREVEDEEEAQEEGQYHYNHSYPVEKKIKERKQPYQVAKRPGRPKKVITRTPEQ